MTSEWGHVFQDPATKEWHEATHLGTYSIDQVRAFLLRFHLGYILLSPNERQPLFRREIERVFAEWLRERIEVDGFTLYVLREP